MVPRFAGLTMAGAAIAVAAAVSTGVFNFNHRTASVAEATAPSQGMLVAAPGMTFAQMVRQSSLKTDLNRRAPITGAVGAAGVFEYRIPGTGMLFRNCRYYFVSPYTHAPHRIDAVNVGLSPHTLSLAEIERANAALRAKLAADGWLTGHEEYRTEEDRTLHGGALRGPEGSIWLKHDIVLSIEQRRMDDPAPGEDSKTAGKWIQFVDLWQRADFPSIERYAFAHARG